MKVLRVAIVAGELSGDTLGAGFLEQLKLQNIAFEAFGVGGPALQAAGLESWWDAREISVMGLSEVIRHLPRLLRLKRRLKKKILERQPHVFIGIDLPDFNLRLARELRSSSCVTVQYVSPTVWAWRPKRVRKIAAAVDQVLCLLPFEPTFYADHKVDAHFVGHALADSLREQPDTLAAREQLDLPRQRPTFALLPGSRVSEVRNLGEPFLATARLIADKVQGASFVTAMASDDTLAEWNKCLARVPNAPPVLIRPGPARTVIAASDVVLLASGTVALEALLIGRPMVVSYRLSGLTRFIVTRFKMLNVNQFSLPNLLAGTALVPELMQDDAVAEKLAPALLAEYTSRNDPERKASYAQIRQVLAQNGNQLAVEAVLKLLRKRGLPISESTGIKCTESNQN